MVSGDRTGSVAALTLLLTAGCAAGPSPGGPEQAPESAPLRDENPDPRGGPEEDGEEPTPEVVALHAFELHYFDERAEEFGAVHYSSAPSETAGVPPQDLTNGGGAALVDLDADGLLDLVVTAPFAPNTLYLNRGEGGLHKVEESGVADLPHTSCVSAADLDADGLRDLLFCTGHRVAMFRNLGEGRFEEAGTLVELRPPARAENVALADLDGDGWVDAWVSTQAREERGVDHPQWLEDRFLRGAGPFEFEDETARMGHEDDRLGQGFAATFLDADRDGDLDVYVINDKGAQLVPQRLFLNPGPGSSADWEEASAEWMLDLPADGMGVAVGDIDLDGNLDLAVTDTNSALHVVSLTEYGAVENAAAWGVQVPDPERFTTSWAPALPDLDNDGDLDLVMAFGRITYTDGQTMHPEENLLWTWDQEAGRYRAAQDLLSQRTPYSMEAWRTVLPGDIDGDGMLELVFTSQIGPVSIQQSEPNGAGWIEVALRGPETNPDGLGARVEVVVGGRKQFRVAAAGAQGVHSTVEPRPHFGLAQFDRAESIEVTWPDGSRTRLEDVPGNRIVTVDWEG